MKGFPGNNRKTEYYEMIYWDYNVYSHNLTNVNMRCLRQWPF